MNSKSAWILLGGELTLTPDLRALPRPHWIVAADGGIRHAPLLGVQPDLWIGDFDSSAGLEFPDVPRQSHPTAKNETDAELALAWALGQGASNLTLLGAFGGRLDHTLALILGSLRLAQQGLSLTLTSGLEWGWPLVPEQPLSLEQPPGQQLSVLACTPLHGLTLSGVRWPLHQANVPLGSGWTVSNEVSGAVRAEVQEGLAFVTVRVVDGR